MTAGQSNPPSPMTLHTVPAGANARTSTLVAAPAPALVTSIAKYANSPASTRSVSTSPIAPTHSGSTRRSGQFTVICVPCPSGAVWPEPALVDVNVARLRIDGQSSELVTPVTVTLNEPPAAIVRLEQVRSCSAEIEHSSLLSDQAMP